MCGHRLWFWWKSMTTDTDDTFKVTTEVTSALTVEGSQADSGSSSTSNLFLEDENRNPALSHSLPQSRADDIREVKILVNKILLYRPQRRGFHCYGLLTLCRQSAQGCGVESEAAWSVYATLDVARALFWKVFEDVDSERTPRICPQGSMRDGKLLGSRMNCGRSGRSSRRMRVLLGN
jgi:hypothetical protein